MGVMPQPFAFYELVVDTGDDGMNTGSSAMIRVLDNSDATVANTTILGPLHDRIQLALTPTVVLVDNLAQLGDASANVLEVNFSPNGGDDWHVRGFSLVGRPTSSSGPDTCIMRWTNAMNSATSTAPNPVVFNSSNTLQRFLRTGCQP